MLFVKLIVMSLTFLTITGCSRSFHIAKIVPGKTSAQEVLHRLNEPDRVQKSTFNDAVDIYVWQDVTVQLEENVVSAVHRQPASHEKYMQFWKQHYQDENTEFRPIADNGTSENYWQLNIPSKGINVIYDEKTDQVVRVIYYEIK